MDVDDEGTTGDAVTLTDDDEVTSGPKDLQFRIDATDDDGVSHTADDDDGEDDDDDEDEEDDDDDDDEELRGAEGLPSPIGLGTAQMLLDPV